MPQPKLPRAEHPLDQLTSTELRKYIGELKAALDDDDKKTWERLSKEDKDLVRGRLGKAYAAYNVLVGTGAASGPPSEVHHVTGPVFP